MFSQRSVSDTFEGWNTSCRQILAACVLNVWIKPWTLEAEQVAFSPFLTSSYLPFLRQVAADLWETGLFGILAVVCVVCPACGTRLESRGTWKSLDPSDRWASTVRQVLTQWGAWRGDGVQHARKKLSVSLRDSVCRPNVTPQSYFDSQLS